MDASKGGRGGFSQVLVCQVIGDRLHAVHACRGDDGLSTDAMVFGNSDEVSVALKRLGAKCPVVALMPRSSYLIRVLELPRVEADEVSGMLSLEAEAQLPPEFGPVELSHRQLPNEKEGFQRYEVYLSRRGDLESHLSRLAEFGLQPQLVVPSAVAWSNSFGAENAADLMVAASDAGDLEVASLGADRAVSVRTIQARPGGEGGGQANQGLIEHLRFVLAHEAPGDTPLTIGWVGSNCPNYLTIGRVVVEDRSARILSPAARDAAATMNASGSGEPLLLLAGAALIEFPDAQALQSGNLLPQHVVSARLRRSIARNTAMASGCVLLSLLLVFAALKVATLRYSSSSAYLEQKILLIEAEGEVVGRRIAQLQAIRAARATRNDFHNVLSGLYDASPGGISYSQVQLTEDRVLHLRGHAPELSLAYLLPEDLEKQEVFSRVGFRTGGQSNKAGGTVTEFRIDCRLNRVAAEARRQGLEVRKVQRK